MMTIFVIAALHAPGRLGAIVYSSLSALFALGGAGVAGRQVWLQHLPPDKVPQIGLSIAEWSLIWFAALFAFALWLLFKRGSS